MTAYRSHTEVEAKMEYLVLNPLCPPTCAPAGDIKDMKELGIWEPYAVKTQTYKTAIEAATMLLRIDDIVSGMTKKQAPSKPKPQVEQEDHDNVDSERMLQE